MTEPKKSPDTAATVRGSKSILNKQADFSIAEANSQPALMTPQEVAEELQVALRTAYDYLAPGGPLHHLRVELGPKIIRVRRKDFEGWCDAI